MARKVKPMWTLVQHSAYGWDRKEGFRHMVETRSVLDRVQQREIERLGGLLFESYTDADEAEYRENYPEGADLLAGKVRGTFAEYNLDGLKLYIPAKDDTA
ncbi:hypothetical protein [Nonomuraea sp. SYSU D8015]|uniref:hypothetical protein n=1 Tax=Nonomuraea sp. SYSU D8015 TaxID=2593644 RepID=UPI0016613B7A|nr:hypothetical protein [Nonomuraea sp. SYSU D8015]